MQPDELPQPSPADLHRQPGPPDAALLQGLPFPSHLHPQPGRSDRILLQGLQLPVVLQGLQLPVLRLQIVGFPAPFFFFFFLFFEEETLHVGQSCQ